MQGWLWWALTRAWLQPPEGDGKRADSAPEVRVSARGGGPGALAITAAASVASSSTMTNAF